MLQGHDTASDPAHLRDPNILICPAPDYPAAPPDGPHTICGVPNTISGVGISHTHATAVPVAVLTVLVRCCISVVHLCNAYSKSLFNSSASQQILLKSRRATIKLDDLSDLSHTQNVHS